MIRSAIQHHKHRSWNKHVFLVQTAILQVSGCCLPGYTKGGIYMKYLDHSDHKLLASCRSTVMTLPAGGVPSFKQVIYLWPISALVCGYSVIPDKHCATFRE